MESGYTRDPKRVEKVLRNKGIVVVMGRGHAKSPEDVINTITAVVEAGYVAEVTFRIPEEVLKDLTWEEGDVVEWTLKSEVELTCKFIDEEEEF